MCPCRSGLLTPDKRPCLIGMKDLGEGTEGVVVRGSWNVLSED